MNIKLNEQILTDEEKHIVIVIGKFIKYEDNVDLALYPTPVTKTFVGKAVLKKDDINSPDLAIKIAQSKMERQYHKYLKFEAKKKIKELKKNLSELEKSVDKQEFIINKITKHIIDLANRSDDYEIKD